MSLTPPMSQKVKSNLKGSEGKRGRGRVREDRERGGRECEGEARE